MINIFYGPKKEFDELIPNSIRPKTLTQLVSELDSSRRNFIFTTEENKPKPKKTSLNNLVATTEEYSMLNESAISSFVTLNNKVNIKNMYLQNPPESVKNQLLRHYPKDTEINESTHNSINIELLHIIDKEFEQVVIGQEEVKKRLLGSLYFSSKEYRKKPVVLMFYGPTGVGKTETAKLIANLLEEKLFRKQFSMYQNNDFADYIFGAKHNQHSLAQDLLERESNIILFDEFDKPAPVFFSAFYQMFDEGVFVDKNYKVNLENSLIICTSNYTSETAIKKSLGEAIASRFDDFIQFKELSNDASQQIIIKSFNNVIEELDDEDKILIDKANTLSDILSQASKFKNARHIKKVIKQLVSYNILKEKGFDV